MDNGWFSRPVAIATGISGDIAHVMNASKALVMLNEHWRIQGSEKFKTARRACLMAIAGETTGDVAMLAFAEAADEAHVLADDAAR